MRGKFDIKKHYFKYSIRTKILAVLIIAIITCLSANIYIQDVSFKIISDSAFTKLNTFFDSSVKESGVLYRKAIMNDFLLLEVRSQAELINKIARQIRSISVEEFTDITTMERYPLVPNTIPELNSYKIEIINNSKPNRNISINLMSMNHIHFICPFIGTFILTEKNIFFVKTLYNAIRFLKKVYPFIDNVYFFNQNYFIAVNKGSAVTPETIRNFDNLYNLADYNSNEVKIINNFNGFPLLLVMKIDVFPARNENFMIAAQINPGKLLNIYFTWDKDRDEYSLLVDNKGHIIYSSNDNAFSQEMKKYFGHNNSHTAGNSHWDVFMNKISSQADNSIFEFKAENNLNIGSYSKVHSLNSYIIKIFPGKYFMNPEFVQHAKMLFSDMEKAIRSSQSRIYYTDVVLYLIITIIIMFIGIYVSKRIIYPIIRLKNITCEIGQGHFLHNIKIKSGDEIESLADSFNIMTDNLKEYIKKLSKNIAARKLLEADIEVARKIQSSLLPKEDSLEPKNSSIDVSAVLIPCKQVSGDFYDYFFY